MFPGCSSCRRSSAVGEGGESAAFGRGGGEGERGEGGAGDEGGEAEAGASDRMTEDEPQSEGEGGGGGEPGEGASEALNEEVGGVRADDAEGVCGFASVYGADIEAWVVGLYVQSAVAMAAAVMIQATPSSCRASCRRAERRRGGRKVRRLFSCLWLRCVLRLFRGIGVSGESVLILYIGYDSLPSASSVLFLLFWILPTQFLGDVVANREHLARTKRLHLQGQPKSHIWH